MNTEELRKSFLIETLFKENEIPMVYSDIDRSITGTAVPVGKSLNLVATKNEMAILPKNGFQSIFAGILMSIRYDKIKNEGININNTMNPVEILFLKCT